MPHSLIPEVAFLRILDIVQPLGLAHIATSVFTYV